MQHLFFLTTIKSLLLCIIFWLPLYIYILIFDIIETVKNYVVIAHHSTWGFNTNIQLYDLQCHKVYNSLAWLVVTKRQAFG